IKADDIRGSDYEDIQEIVLEKIKDQYKHQQEEFGDQMSEFERMIVLRTIDRKWTDHIDTMDQLRTGIHLRSYGQINPLREYQNEGLELFETMLSDIEDEVSKYILKATIDRGEQVEPKQVGENDGKEKVKPKSIVKDEEVGRNDTCPCGSGKKYKNCHDKA